MIRSIEDVRAIIENMRDDYEGREMITTFAMRNFLLNAVKRAIR